MPLVPSDYQPSALFKKSHFSTVYCGLFRKVTGLVQQRERLQLPDGDFMDLDWSRSTTPTKKVVVLLHGLEGDAQRPYIMGSARALVQQGFDVCAVNYRGCSGEPNLKYQSYHSGATHDLGLVIDHILANEKYLSLYLMGFSLGGNLLLKYLGESHNIPLEIKGAVAVSVPSDLKDACDQLLSFNNRHYSIKFKANLISKLKQKRRQFPDHISKQAIARIKTLKDFDDTYTAPAHGFKDALDYYQKCSCNQFLRAITVPSLIINSKNDSFLGERCYPIHIAESHPKLYLEMPTYGGHVGFWGKNGVTYAEQRAVDFFTSVSNEDGIVTFLP